MKAQELTRETVLSIGVTDRGFPQFRVGDTIEVSQIIKEGNKERIQKFAGDVIAMRRSGIASTFTVRRIGANNIGVERVYPLHSPIISDIALVKRGKVRRAKLFYVRDRVGKAARIKEKIVTKAQQKAVQESAEQSVAPAAE